MEATANLTWRLAERDRADARIAYDRLRAEQNALDAQAERAAEAAEALLGVPADEEPEAEEPREPAPDDQDHA